MLVLLERHVPLRTTCNTEYGLEREEIKTTVCSEEANTERKQ